MAVKTITIDLEAYDILLKAKEGNESFSQVIKKTLAGEAKTGASLLKELGNLRFGEKTLDAMEMIVAERERDYIDSPVIDKD